MPHVSCPKPGCGWTLDPATVPAGEVVTCPRCGQRFKLATPSPATRREGGFGSSLLAVGGVVLAVAVLAGVVVVAVSQKRNVGVARPAPTVADIRNEAHNFAFTPPNGDWAADADTRTALGVNVAGFRRTTPEAWAALAVKDYGNRAPLDSELRDQMVATLNRVFNNLPAEPTLEPTTWAGRPARVWRFRGERRSTNAICAGEAVAMTDKGVGYWFYGWAAERDFDPADAQKVRGGFRLLDGRANWTATAASEVVFRSPAGGYQLTAYERVWETVPKPDGPDLELRGVLKGRGKRDFPPRAEVRVWRVKDAGEPAAVADAKVRQENSRDPAVFGPTAFTERTDEPAGDAPPGPEAPAAGVRRLRVVSGTEETGQTSRLLVFAGVRVGDEVVVAEGSCPWDEREAWERRLVQLVGSLR